MDLEKHTLDSERIDLGLDSLDYHSDEPASQDSLMSLNHTGADSHATDNATTSASSLAVDEQDIKIVDKDSPIVLLVGPPASGKSMTLVRLSRYLRKEGYTVRPDYTFKSDPLYKARCERFMENLSTKEALEGNALNEFLMIKVVKHGRTVCQILEAPGEHYFKVKSHGNNKPKNFPPYLTEITRNMKNRKIWVFITEAEWNEHASEKTAYVEMIRACKNQILRPTDRCILLYNKIDRKEELYENGRLNSQAAEKAMMDEYEKLPEVFRNQNPLTSLWRKYNYIFVPFCSGYYTKQPGGKERYNESEELYPRVLWENLMKCIKG